MTRRVSKRSGGGFTLAEVLIASVILALCAVPVIGVFITSKRGIVNTDKDRERRFFVSTVFRHLNRTSLHFIWNYYGPSGFRVPFEIENNQSSDFRQSGVLRGQIAETDPLGRLAPGPADQVNPLGFTEDFLRDVARAGYRAEIEFDFFTRKSLGVDGQDNPGSVGILHMQAGWAKVTLIDLKAEREGEDPIAYQTSNVIMCPAIVGRPGLKLSSCPAINDTVKREYKPILRQVEGD